MFQVDRVIYRVCDDEGYRAVPYQDILSVWTFGYGTTRYRGGPVTENTPAISVTEARTLLKADILNAIEDCQVIYGETFPVLHSVHQEVLICLAYQLGRRKLMGFTEMNKAIIKHDYTGFFRELKDSLIYRQTTNRINRYLVALKTATWPELTH